MGLLDGLGKKISQTSQSLISKANEMADISKLNSQIAEEEKVIKSVYMQLGEQYYTKYNSAPDEDFLQLCQSITEEKEKIAVLKKQLIATKKVKTCPKCGAECESSLLFCGSCGAELSKMEEQTDAKFCKNCGQSISADAVFCPFCGNKE